MRDLVIERWLELDLWKGTAMEEFKRQEMNAKTDEELLDMLLAAYSERFDSGDSYPEDSI